jgi:hypothetical protein
MIPPKPGADAPDSERAVFRHIARASGTEDWVVFHSVGLSSVYTGHFGELDFVVLIPNRGIVCLEVKGGAISQRNGLWTTRDRSGRTHDLDPPPYRQVQNAMFKLSRAIGKKFGTNSREALVPVGWMMVFPDSPAPPVSPEFVRADVIDRDDLAGRLADRISNCPTLEQSRNNLDGGTATPYVLDRIRSYIRPDFDRVLAPGAALHPVEAALRALTEEQYAFLDSVQYNRRCIVLGPAGCGKTTLALEQARRMANDGKRVLLLCFNRLLGKWLTDITAESSGHIVAGSLHRLLSERIAHSSLAADFKAASDHKNIYDEIFPLYGLQAIEETGERFDVVLVDEAQDFDPDVISTLAMAWTGENLEASIVFFGDFSRQAIYGKSEDALRKLQDRLGNAAIISLTRNCRNTRRIALQTSYLSRFDGYRNLEGQPDGDAVDVRFYRSAQDEATKLAQIMHDLYREGIPAKDIVILGKRRLENWKAAEQLGLPWPIVNADEGNHSSVPYSTIHAFKGLEAPVVILANVEALDDDEEALLYVGMSRARVRLYMLIDEGCRRTYDQKVSVGIAKAIMA